MKFWRPSLFTVGVRSRAPESTRVDDRARSRVLSGALRARCRVSARVMSLAIVAVLVAVHVPGTPAAHAAESCVDLPTRPFDIKAAGISGPYGLWSDGATLWVANYGYSKLYAFDRASGERHASRDIVLAAVLNRLPTGLWSDGTTLYVANHYGGTVYAYDFANGGRDGSADIDTGFLSATGMWGDEDTLWVADRYLKPRVLRAYDRDTGSPSNDLDVYLSDTVGNITSVWASGGTLWVADGERIVHGFPWSGGGSETKLEPFASQQLSDDSGFGTGLWSDGEQLYVTDLGEGLLETYSLPVDVSASALTSLRLSGIGDFDTADTVAAATVAPTVATTTVTAAAADSAARVSFTPADADNAAPGHQVALAEGRNLLHVTVSADGIPSRTYTVAVTRLATASNDAALSSLELSGVSIGAFDPAVHSYTASVPYSVNHTTMYLEAADESDRARGRWRADDRRPAALGEPRRRFE